MHRKQTARLLMALCLVSALAGCSSNAPTAKKGPAAEADARLEIQKTFGALQKAVKERNGAKTYEMLDSDCQHDADRLAKTAKDVFAKADAA
jgi:hypothetical protein